MSLLLHVLGNVILFSVLAVVIVSLLNLIFAIARRTSHPRAIPLATIGVLVFAALSASLKSFLDTALSFQGWSSIMYALLLAAALVLCCTFFLLTWSSRPAS